MHALHPGDLLDADHALVAGLVGEPGCADEVADGVDALLARPEPFVDDDMAAVDLHLGAVQADVLDIAGDADGEHDPVDRDRLRLAAGFDLRGDAVLRSEEHTSELQSLMRISY